MNMLTKELETANQDIRIQIFLGYVDSKFNTHHSLLLDKIANSKGWSFEYFNEDIYKLGWLDNDGVLWSLDIHGCLRHMNPKDLIWTIDENPEDNCWDDSDDLDSEDDEPTSYSQTWQNTGMKDQPIYYFHTKSKDGHLGDAIGTIMIEIPNLKDTTFYVVGHGDSVTLEVEFEHGDSDNPYRYEYEFSRNLEECRDLWDEVIDTICDVQNYGRGAIYSNSEEVINCIKDISDKLSLGYVFEERYCEEEMSEYIGVYSADMASKMYLGKNVDFAFRLDVAQSMVAENENAHCDFQLHDVIMEYPNGDLDRDKGYVIFFDTEE